MIFGLFAATVMPFAVCAQLPVGRVAPEIKLPDSLGKWKPLSSVKSKIILLDFWAAWCDPCIQSMPELKRLYTAYHDKGLDVYAVSLDKDYRHWVATCRRLELPFILVNDAYGLGGKVSQDYLITSIPNKMLLKDGKVFGADMSLSDLEKLISNELK
jgi:alkyl hydroperoxide reductase subunit AhpC